MASYAAALQGVPLKELLVRTLKDLLAARAQQATQEFLPWLEAKSPLLRRGIGSAMGMIREPFTAGMGLWLERLDDECCRVRLPSHLRNRDQNWNVHSAAMGILVETAAREYWQRHFVATGTTMSLQSSSLRFFKSSRSDLRAIYTCHAQEREAGLYLLRSSGLLELETPVRVYDSHEQMIAEAQLVWDVRQVQQLPGG